MMKTVEDRANDFIEKLPWYCQKYKEQFKEQLIIELKRQDKITRHSCAENVKKYADGYDLGGAIQAIMNTKAI